MNDKLKQSLSGRLSGMRWGEREQAEVFRQIQQKEMQEVKHVRRSTGLLALAAAMLFFVMGAAFALTGKGHPDETTPLAQPTAGGFSPIAAIRYENDYLIMTVDSVNWAGTDISIDVKLLLKEPAEYGLAIGGYSNPGGYDRTIISASISDFYCIPGTDEWPEMGYYVPEVISMTNDSAIIRMMAKDVPSELDALDVRLQLSGSVDKERFSKELTLSISRQSTQSVVTEKEADAQRMIVIDNALITGYCTELSYTDGQVAFTIDIVPKKPWYGINTLSTEKSLLVVRCDSMSVCDGDNPQPLATLEMQSTLTEEGVRYSGTGTVPQGLTTVVFSGSFFARDTNAGVINNSPVYIRLTPPAPSLPARTGQHVGGTAHVSAYLEDAWYDGITAQGTIRVCADDPSSCKLAITPNTESLPSESTWVVILDDSDERLTHTFDMDSDTGDVLIRFT